MRHCAEAAGVEIPPHVLHGNVKLFDACKQLVVIGLTLRAADDFANHGEEHVHGAYGAAVFVLLHIESLDFLGIVGKYHRALEVLFDEETLMLALKVDTPLYGELELFARSLEYLDAFGVGQTDEIVVENEFKTLYKLGSKCSARKSISSRQLSRA